MKIDKKILLPLSIAIILIAGLLIYANRPRQHDSGTESGSRKEGKVDFKSTVMQEGYGAFSVEPGDKIAVNYIGYLEDNTMFDSNLADGEPFETFIDKGEAPIGWDEALIGMKVGEKRKITVPPTYQGSGSRENLPENAVLYYEIELVEIK